MKYVSCLLVFIIMIGCGSGVRTDHEPAVRIVAPEGYTIKEVIDPCGDGPGQDEILLVLSEGSVVAWYKDLGLVELEDGNYVTTDSQSCSFSIINGEYVE